MLLKKISQGLLSFLLSFVLLGQTTFAGLSPGGGGPLTPDALCLDDSDTWIFCETTFTFGDTSARIAEGWFTALDTTTLVLGGAVTGDLHVNDDAEVSFGNTYAAPDVRLGWNTAQTVDALYLGLSTAQNTFVIGELGDIAFDFAHGAATNPTQFIHSATQSTTQWLSLSHNQTNGVIDVGTGVVSIPDGISTAAITATGALDIDVAALGATITNTADSASSQSVILEGDRATPADGDAAYITLRLSDSAGNQDEQARISWSATTVLDGATQDGDLFFSTLTNGALTEYMRIDGSAIDIEVNSVFDFGFSSGGTATSYWIGRDTAGTNQFQANAPTGAGFRWSINDANALTLSSTGDLAVANGGGLIIGNTAQVTVNGVLAEFQMLGTAQADTSSVIGDWSADAFSGALLFVKSRNATIGSSTIVVDNDQLGEIAFIADDGTDFANKSASFFAEVDDATPAENSVGTAFVWQQQDT
ncbi:hypothetical protein HY469_02255, partial [Candidatus Roizmanbacteria bacterium]|nr:hypothetical protein [Candidatus Roizmanbacteria bacterium]